MALGADRRKVVGMVMGNVSVQAMVGLAIGAPIALAAGKFLSSKFPAVNAFDLAVFAIAIFSVGFSALIAGFLPARRAANVDPMHTLRAE